MNLTGRCIKVQLVGKLARVGHAVPLCPIELHGLDLERYTGSNRLQTSPTLSADRRADNTGNVTLCGSTQWLHAFENLVVKEPGMGRFLSGPAK